MIDIRTIEAINRRTAKIPGEATEIKEAIDLEIITGKMIETSIGIIEEARTTNTAMTTGETTSMATGTTTEETTCTGTIETTDMTISRTTSMAVK